MAARFQVRVQRAQLRAITDKLGPKLVREAAGEAIVEATDLLLQAARERAPRRRGTAVASLRREYDRRKPPLYGKVTADATARGGFRYLWALNSSKRIRYRHRAGSRTGRLTRSWFTGALGLVRRQIPRLLADAERRARSWWRR